VFEALLAELTNSGPMPIIADLNDITTMEDCMLLFCLCQQSWQNDVFMIGYGLQSCQSCLSLS
jgi:hypothetical protein